MPSRIGLLAECYRARDLREELELTRSSESAADESRFLESRFTASRKARLEFRAALAEGRGKMPQPLTARYLPEWYFVSHPDLHDGGKIPAHSAERIKALGRAVSVASFMSLLYQ
jgi:hypothetical protein